MARAPKSSARAPKSGWATEDAIQNTATMSASVVGPRSNLTCKVGSSAPRIAVIASFTV
jgi:hypothetical protein